jgi:hypothetical protein
MRAISELCVRGSRLKGDFRYSSDKFLWPPPPPRRRGLRREIMARLGYSLRTHYRTLDTPGDNPLREAHTRLDTAVRAAYAMPKAADSLAFLLTLNLELAAKEKAGEPIIPPGLHLPESERAVFASADCVSLTEAH